MNSPNFDETALIDEDSTKSSKEVKGYPAREVVGALQWVATCARPDIAAPAAALARHVASVPTVAFAKACRKVLQYLLTTASIGVSYSPEEEEKFNEIYATLLPEGRDLPRLNIFPDAGFANNVKCFHSTSGSIGYWRSVPIYWKSQRQGVRAYSTAESEYIAASDTIVVSEHNDFMSFFERLPSTMVEPSYGISPTLEDAVLWVDNESAIATANATDTKPRSRHYALRYLRVREASQSVVLCPTHLMKADGLSKVSLTEPQRGLLLHHVSNPTIDDEGISLVEERNHSYLLMCEFSVVFGF